MTEEKIELIRRLGPGRYLHRIIPIIDASGKVIHRVVKPLMVEVRARDVVQIVVGASILAIPAELWSLRFNASHRTNRKSGSTWTASA